MEYNFIARQQFSVHATRDRRTILANQQSLHRFSAQIGVWGACVHDEEDITKGKGRPGTV
jgi:hypothetical protein